jgi:hypothetical protein
LYLATPPAHRASIHPEPQLSTDTAAATPVITQCGGCLQACLQACVQACVQAA